jgi:hypothetical protein
MLASAYIENKLEKNKTTTLLKKKTQTKITK